MRQIKMQYQKAEEKAREESSGKGHNSASEDLYERFEFRNIRPEEAEQTAEIERVCFPPNEACTPEMMRQRVIKAPELFLTAVERRTGRIAGFINGLSTNENTLRDEFFVNADLYDPEGQNIMILGVDVLPDYRKQGLARELINQYLRREEAKGRKKIVLTCLASKVEMYQKMGFKDHGVSESTWGGEQWHEMSCTLNG